MPKADKEQARLLREIGISGSYASEILRGIKTPPLEKTFEIFRKTGVPVGQIRDMSPRALTVIGKAAALLEAA